MSHHARANTGSNWDKLLAFVDDSRNPLRSVISIGGVISDAEKWEFTPESSGTRNRDFSHVTADGRVYCYEWGGASERILVQLTSAVELTIQKQNLTCADERAFTTPALYRR